MFFITLFRYFIKLFYYTSFPFSRDADSRKGTFCPFCLPIHKKKKKITHSDGSRMTTQKSKLLKKLEELQDGYTQAQLPVFSVTLIDGGLLIHSFLSTLGRITNY